MQPPNCSQRDWSLTHNFASALENIILTRDSSGDPLSASAKDSGVVCDPLRSEGETGQQVSGEVPTATLSSSIGRLKGRRAKDQGVTRE